MYGSYEAWYSSLVPKVPTHALLHTTRPDRAKDSAEEAIFLKEWTILTEGEKLQQVLVPYLPKNRNWKCLTERDRKVATSVFQWLGTGEGLLFLRRSREGMIYNVLAGHAKLFKRTYKSKRRPRSLLESWRECNTRVDWYGHGYSALEMILDEMRLDPCLLLGAKGDKRLVSPVSTRDILISEGVIRLIMSPAGAELVNECETQIEAFKRFFNTQFNLYWNQGIVTA